MAEPNSIEYRHIDGFPGYRVGNNGSVWRQWVNCVKGRIRRDTWKPMKLAVNNKGYFSVNLTPEQGGKYQTFRVHRLVLAAFVGPCPEGMECRHLNGVHTDNRLENLAWGTQEENRDDNRRMGRYLLRAKMYTHEGRTMCIKDWATHLSIPYSCLYGRIHSLGMSFEEAISRPYKGTSSNGGHWKGRLA